MSRIHMSEFHPTSGGVPTNSETRFHRRIHLPGEKIDIVHSETHMIRVPTDVEVSSLPFRGELYPGECKTLENTTHDGSQYNALEVETFQALRVVDVLVDGKATLLGGDEIDALEFRPGETRHRFHLPELRSGQIVGLRLHSVGHEKREVRARLLALPVE